MNRSLVKRISTVLVCSVLGTIVGVYAVAEIQDWLDRTKGRRLDEEMLSHALNPDNLPSPESFYPIEAVPRPPVVSGFKILSVAEAVGLVGDEEWVLALEIDGEARAYPLNVLDGPEREVFNDELAGRAIVATW
jgi:hypothetical protein